MRLGNSICVGLLAAAACAAPCTKHTDPVRACHVTWTCGAETYEMSCDESRDAGQLMLSCRCTRNGAVAGTRSDTQRDWCSDPTELEATATGMCGVNLE